MWVCTNASENGGWALKIEILYVMPLSGQGS